MCGRYALDVTGSEIAAAFGDGLGAIAGIAVGTADSWRPRWNIAPTLDAPIIRATPAGRAVVDLLRWGLVPPWADDPAMGSRLINARGETIATKPSFRDGFRHRRALVPARAFYEWASIDGRRVPHAIRAEDGGLLAFAAIWSRADRVPAGPIETFTIVTTTPNDRLRSVHDRMPVVLDGPDRGRWLDHRLDTEGGPSADELQQMLRPCPEVRLHMHPVSTRVNRPSQDGPDLLDPVTLDPEPMPRQSRTRGPHESPGLFDAEA